MCFGFLVALRAFIWTGWFEYSYPGVFGPCSRLSTDIYDIVATEECKVSPRLLALLCRAQFDVQVACKLYFVDGTLLK